MKNLGEGELDDGVIVIGDIGCCDCEKDYFVVLTIEAEVIECVKVRKNDMA